MGNTNCESAQKRLAQTCVEGIQTGCRDDVQWSDACPDDIECSTTLFTYGKDKTLILNEDRVAKALENARSSESSSKKQPASVAYTNPKPPRIATFEWDACEAVSRIERDLSATSALSSYRDFVRESETRSGGMRGDFVGDYVPEIVLWPSEELMSSSVMVYEALHAFQATVRLLWYYGENREAGDRGWAKLRSAIERCSLNWEIAWDRENWIRYELNITDKNKTTAGDKYRYAELKRSSNGIIQLDRSTNCSFMDCDQWDRVR